ncbi:MAG: hypothetical protein ACRDG7_06360 [Candidatus Limnocylindria bacterium]
MLQTTLHVDAITDVARQLEAIGHHLLPADAFADAALVARRAGLPAEQLEAEAAPRYRACAAVPLLGEPPDRLQAAKPGEARRSDSHRGRYPRASGAHDPGWPRRIRRPAGDEW